MRNLLGKQRVSIWPPVLWTHGHGRRRKLAGLVSRGLDRSGWEKDESSSPRAQKRSLVLAAKLVSDIYIIGE